MQPVLAIALSAEAGMLVATIPPAPLLPLGRLLLGRPVAEAAAMLPRIFNLCRAAQIAAIHLALGLPEPQDPERLKDEVLREHLVKLLLTWPQHLGLAPRPFPAAEGAAAALFGASGRFPDTPAGFQRWLASGEGCAPVFAGIAAAFAPGEACATLPDVTPERPMDAGALENSTALRHPGHPVLDQLAAQAGRGPLWRAAARLLDAGACLGADLDACLPVPHLLPDGVVLTPAARGQYALRARARDGRLAELSRVTPTDHLLAPGGMLERSFAALPAAKAPLAALLLDILDPCLPVSLTQVMERGGQDA